MYIFSRCGRYAKIYKTVKMIVFRRKFDFCSIFLRKHRWWLYVESILRVQPLYLSSTNKIENNNNNNNFYPCTTRFATYNMGCKVHEHNFMRHFLALLSMLSDLYPAYYLTNPCTRSIRKERYEYVQMQL